MLRCAQHDSKKVSQLEYVTIFFNTVLEYGVDMGRLRNVAVTAWLFGGLFVLGLPDSGLAGEGMRVMREKETVSIYKGERVLLRYRCAGVPFKPYVDQLFTPGGVNILLDAPHDHLHHHALMFAITVDGVNFWEEHKSPGQQAPGPLRAAVDSRNTMHPAGFLQELDWKNPRTGDALLKERRTIEVGTLTEPAVTLLTWQSDFTPPGGKDATLTGSHYQGLGLRFIRSMDAGGEFRNADGKAGTIFRGDERLVRSRWCAYTAKADGKDVTVAMFDHPNNERHPAMWFTMSKPFAYLSATMGLHKQPFQLPAGHRLGLRYAVALWDGRTGDDEIEKLYKTWAALPRETAGKPKQRRAK